VFWIDPSAARTLWDASSSRMNADDWSRILLLMLRWRPELARCGSGDEMPDPRDGIRYK
jgi:hypothetical protein